MNTLKLIKTITIATATSFSKSADKIIFLACERNKSEMEYG